jgi:BirA family biotin operon repressor/biotin-[acetyl-CoA-carboxylase] ligase
LPNKNTLFVGKVFLHFPTLNSTNQYALNLLAKSRPSEGTVISTYRQVSGRGQIGRKWEGEPDKNIAISLILYPSFLAVRQQFLLNQAMALATADFLTKYSEKTVKVKWPNDIYIEDRKVAGILIQNTLSGTRFQSSVVGIGVNVNQEAFPETLPNPTSLKRETGREYDLGSSTSTLCHCLEARYLQLKSGQEQRLKADYLERLYRRGQKTAFYPANGNVFYGTIQGLNEQGKLLIEMENGEREVFDLQSIRYR